MSCGIYTIKVGTEKCYIGKSVNVEKRLRQHKWQLKNHKHGNKYLQAAFDKYQKLEFSILEKANEQNLAERECYWIHCFDTTNREKGFNLEQPTTASKIVSEETKQKISKGNKGKRLTEETKIKIGLAGIGKKRPDAKIRMIGNELKCKNTYKLMNINTKEIVTVTNLAKFARERELHHGSLQETIKGQHGRTQHKGWIKCA